MEEMAKIFKNNCMKDDKGEIEAVFITYLLI